MTNLQLLLSIGIPSLLFGFSWIQQSTYISRLEMSTDKGFESIERRLEAMRHETVALRDNIYRDMVALYERAAVVEAKQS